MPRLLDLFCCQGGASVGYQRAGFEVVGVDIAPQPLYQGGEFVQADAFEFVEKYGPEFHVITASPKCQLSTTVQHLGKARNGKYPKHPDQITPLRPKLQKTGRPWVIENVVGARRLLNNPIRLCGTMFGLKVYRHRLFEANVPLSEPKHYPHRDKTPSAGNGVSPKGFISVCGMGGVRGLNGRVVEYWSAAMGIDWMDRYGLTQAIPPAYTEYIGKHLLQALSVKA